MKFSTLATTLGLTAQATALGRAVVHNNCAEPVYLWSVGGAVGPRQTLHPNEIYSESVRHDAASGGVSLKITRGPDGLWDGSAQTNFAYSLTGDRVWYDLSNVFGAPFEGDALSVNSDDPSCGNICWADGVNPGGNHVRDCSAEATEVLTLCAWDC
ncbi:putative BYS1 domain protein [Aspergillus campestris IBT 28561]|uniref:BYS1 domain protein n=1 Tax=Aspergillus campestris (strain IBT 28561) TaxID=1392248 RepID=A0A2I1DFN2_ASPC2|nr:putative BYS1 domain protein [Aspergillus campestris IBT 28561]PKY08661.1 putative BYS1 domain protein [Aspergillus campestris IBT 28561]